MNKKAYDKKYREAHREERKAYDKTHRKEIKAYNKKYNETHREEIKAYNKKYNEAHRKERKAYGKKFQKLGYHITKINKKLEIGNMCACCGLKDIFNLTKDHIVSMKMIRDNPEKYKDFDINKPSNLQLLCFACNQSKNGHKKRCTLPHDNPEIKKMIKKTRRQKSKK